MKYLNGDIYSGQWKSGKKDGKGTYIFNQTGMKFYLIAYNSEIRNFTLDILK